MSHRLSHAARRGGPPRFARLALSLSAALVAVGITALDADARPLSRAEVVRLAVYGPDARVARARAAGAHAMADQSGVVSLENPELQATVGPRFDPAGDDVALSAQLSLPVDIFGQRGARMEAAHAEAKAADAAARRDVVAPVREALGLHAEALAAKARRAIYSDRVQLSEELTATAARRRQAGEVADNDVAVTRLQLGREKAALARATGDVQALEKQLAAVLGLPEDETAEASGPLVPEPAPRPAVPLAPTVDAAEMERAAAHARVTREETAQRPTVRLLGGYQLDQGAHIVTGGLAIPIPLYGTRDASIAAARGEAQAADAAVVAAKRRAKGDLIAAYSRVEATGRALDATRPAKEEARAMVQRAQRAYSAGESDLPTLLLVRREALESELAVVDAELAYAQASLDAAALEGRWSR